MNKKITLLLCAILIVALAFGACANKGGLSLPEDHANADIPALASPGPEPNNDAAIVVMDVNGRKVYKDEFNTAYSTLCSEYGVAEDDPALMGLLQDATLDLLLSEQVILINLEEQGYMNLSQQDAATVADQAQGELDYSVSYSMDSIIEGLDEGYTQAELDAAVIVFEDDLLAQYDLTRETFMNYFIEKLALENAKAVLLADAVPTDEDVLTQFNDAVEADKATIGDDLLIYEAYLNQNGMSHYIPNGIRYVRHILIKLDDELVSQVNTLRQAGDTEGADAALLQALKTIQEEADDVLARLQSGDLSFDQGIADHNDDPGMASNPDGYEIYEGNSMYMESFSQGAMSLTTLLDITGLVVTDYGYHIIEYSSDRESGPIAFETVKDQIYDALFTNLQDSAWAELIAEWKATVEYTVYKEVL